MTLNARRSVEDGINVATDAMERGRRRWMKIDPATIFCVVICGVMIFVISMTVRTQSRGASAVSGGSLASELDEDTAVSISPNSSLPTAEYSELPSASPSEIYESTAPSGSPSEIFESSMPSSSPSDPSTTAPSNEPTTIVHNQVPSARPSNALNSSVSFDNSSVYTSSNNTSQTNSTNATTIVSPISSPAVEPSSSSPSTDNVTYTSLSTLRQPTSNPSQSPTNITYNCFTTSLYDSIDTDIETLKLTITDSIERSHFLGGIVRLTAHDFMDYDRSSSSPFGPDGCFDPTHEANAGLPESVWCDTCILRVLYESKYAMLSRADFWIASANAVIRQTSVNNTLNLKETFTWGRIDRDECQGSAERLPVPSGCGEVESTFLDRMGLEWRDAVALMGAHSLGRGNASFSGHNGVWVDNADDAQIFDKQYYEELYLNAWRPRNAGADHQDWTTGDTNDSNPRMMLNTDLCLVYDIESIENQCCTRTNIFLNGTNACLSAELSRSRCPYYSSRSSRKEATEAVTEYLGGDYPNSNNEPFYEAFGVAWVKATTSGYEALKPLGDGCDG